VEEITEELMEKLQDMTNQKTKAKKKKDMINQKVQDALKKYQYITN
jgi:hypothetical protein